MSKLRYKGPARPIPVIHDPFNDVWLACAFTVISVAAVLIFSIWG